MDVRSACRDGRDTLVHGERHRRWTMLQSGHAVSRGISPNDHRACPRRAGQCLCGRGITAVDGRRSFYTAVWRAHLDLEPGNCLLAPSAIGADAEPEDINYVQVPWRTGQD